MRQTDQLMGLIGIGNTSSRDLAARYVQVSGLGGGKAWFLAK